MGCFCPKMYNMQLFLLKGYSLLFLVFSGSQFRVVPE